MYRISPAPLAVLVTVTAIAVVLTAASLPFFMAQAWGPLWGVEWWPEGVVRSFGRVGPFCGFSGWAEWVAVPVATVLLLSVFVLTVGIVAMSLRNRA